MPYLGEAAIEAITEAKHNLAAVTNPTVTDDINAGYTIGSRWINTAADEEYVCTDNTAGAAGWELTTDVFTVGNSLAIGGGASNYILNIYNANAGQTAYNQYTNFATGNAPTDGTLIGLDSSGNAVIMNQETTNLTMGINNQIIVGMNSSNDFGVYGSTTEHTLNRPTLYVDTSVDKVNILTGGYSPSTTVDAMLEIYKGSAAATDIWIGNSYTGHISAGLRIGIDGSGHAYITNQTGASTELRLGTGNGAKWTIAQGGGLRSVGAIGGDQGSNSINAGSYYKHGRQSVWYERDSYTVTGSAINTYTFSGLNYSTDLEYRLVIHLKNGSATTEQLYLQINGDTGTQYDWRNTLNTGTIIASNGSSLSTGIEIARDIPTSVNTGGAEVDIYIIGASTTYHRVMGRAMTVDHTSNPSVLNTLEIFGQHTSAVNITSLTIKPAGANNVLGVGTELRLYALR